MKRENQDDGEDVKIKVLGIRIEAKKVTIKLIVLVFIVLLLAIGLVYVAGTPLHQVVRGRFK